MSRLKRRFAFVALCVVLVAGCGNSSESTSHSEALAVAAAEQGLTTAWRQVNGQAQERCKGKPSDAAATRCFAAAVVPGERKAEARFTRVIERVLDAGVGSECEKALEGALAEISAIPLFPGEAAATCGKESRSE
jgi:hypothetical protein